MTRVIFGKDGKNVSCLIKDSEMGSGYVDYTDILRNIQRSRYIVKIKDADLLLQTSNVKYVFKDYKRILAHPDFYLLMKDIERTIEREGFIDLSEKGDINPTPKRDSKSNNGQIKRISLLTLTMAVLLNVFAYALSNENIKATETPDVAIVQEQVMQEFERKVQNQSSLAANVIYDADTNSVNIPEEIPDEIVEEIKKEVTTVNLEFDELSSTDKAVYAKEQYYDLISKYAADFGLDANLMLGIATEERGVHSSSIDDGGGLGLMQIQYDVWIGHEMTYYRLNPETGEFVRGTVKITDERMKNLETNIETGCMIFQECLRNSKYNLSVAIQMYNMGYGTMQKILGAYANAKGITIEDILNNPSDLGWLDYRAPYAGDPKYLERVNMWVLENEFTVINSDTLETVSIAFTNANEESMNSSKSIG